MANCWSCRNQGGMTCITCDKKSLYWFSFKRWLSYVGDYIKLTLKAIMEEILG